MDFRTFHIIETEEGVPVRLELAGPASRLAAYGLDGVLTLSLMALVMLASTVQGTDKTMRELIQTLTPLTLFLIGFGYHMIQEWLWNGRTLGKQLMGIRVVRMNGQPIGFWEVLGRNLLRVVDLGVMGIGLPVMLANRDERRLGDFIGGTMVIREEPLTQWFPQPKLDDASAADIPPEELETTATALSMPPAINLQLTPEERVLLAEYRSRRANLMPEARHQLTEHLCKTIGARLHVPLTSEAELDSLWTTLDKETPD